MTTKHTYKLSYESQKRPAERVAAMDRLRVFLDATALERKSNAGGDLQLIFADGENIMSGEVILPKADGRKIFTGLFFDSAPTSHDILKLCEDHSFFWIKPFAVEDLREAFEDLFQPLF